MFCPQCGQQQVSGVTRFCSRCGFPLDGVVQLLNHGGLLPVLRDPDEPVPVSARRKGVKQGGLLFLSGALIVPILGLLASFSNVVFFEVIAASAVITSKKTTLLKLANSPSIGTISAPERNSSPPCLTPFRRAETGTGSSGSRSTGSKPPWLSNCTTPSRGKPQREQNRMTPVTCCWPHCGQNMGIVPRQRGC